MRKMIESFLDRFHNEAIGFVCWDCVSTTEFIDLTKLKDVDQKLWQMLQKSINHSKYEMHLVPVIITQFNRGMSGRDEQTKFFSLCNIESINRLKLCQFFYIDCEAPDEGHFIDEFDIHEQTKYCCNQRPSAFDYWNIFFNYTIVVTKK